MSNRFMLVFIAMIAVFVGLLVFNKDEAASPTVDVQASTHTTGGGAENSVTLVEYGDFECPACAAYYSIINEVKEKYGDKLTFQFRHFPLVSIHPNAMAAHRAAEAAGKQGKFFEMHDLLYENAASWSSQATQNPTPVLEGFAESLSLNMEQYRQDISSIETKNVIEADIAEGGKLNVASTPTFIINGTKVEENPRDLEGFSALIDAALGEDSTDSDS